MFGIFRYVLAIFVAAGHLGHIAHWLANYGVLAFYIISGFLMTRILKETYSYTPSGIGHFALNRFLRLYPLYYAVFVINMVLRFTMPFSVDSISAATNVPQNAGEWIANLTIFGLTSWIPGEPLMTTRVVNSAWSLNIELWFYLIMALGAVRRPVFVMMWLALAVAQIVHAFTHGYDFYDRYQIVTAGLFPFALGAMLYYILPYWNPSPAANRIWCAAAIAAWLGIAAISGYEGMAIINFANEGLYISMVASFAVILGLARFKPGTALAGLDKAMGNLSYPIFLLHWTAGIIMFCLLPALNKQDNSLFLASLPLLHIMAWLLHRWVEKPFEPLRARIRRSSFDKLQDVTPV